MVKVYSHKRSGTNFLLATLYKNFEFNDVSRMITTTKDTYDDFLHIDEDNGAPIYKGNNVTWRHPYSKLNGDHKPCRVAKPNMIYIVRDPRDTLLSLFNLKGSVGKFKDWLNPNRIKNWYNHVNSYVNKGVYIVKYEDLMTDFENTMTKIEENFGLKRKNDSFEMIDDLVGWAPKNGKDKLKGEVRDKSIYSEDINNKIRGIVPKNFLGYEI